ncbi:MAG: hypothetical protein K2K24_01470 [Clostridia bacterium]|nr:hypothetical protein [Clostridia bacterium]
MVILKKIVIMTEYGKSNCSGIVKFENFAGRTSCFVRILGMNTSGVICIKCGDDIIYCSDLFEGEKHFNALYDLNKNIQIVVLKGGAIVSLGSSKGRFSPNAIMDDIHKYFAIKSGAVEQTFAKSEDDENVVAEDIAVKAQEESNTDVAKEVSMQEVEENIEDVQALAVEEQVAEVEETTAKKRTKVAKNESQVPFYKKIEDNMQELFDKNEPDEELALLIPDSKWVRVSLGEDGYYVVGIIYSDEVPNIICYGVPDKDGSNPPQSNENCRQWMEIEKGGRGYWMMYQSAQTGETITSSII